MRGRVERRLLLHDVIEQNVGHELCPSAMADNRMTMAMHTLTSLVCRAPWTRARNKPAGTLTFLGLIATAVLANAQGLGQSPPVVESAQSLAQQALACLERGDDS